MTIKRFVGDRYTGLSIDTKPVNVTEGAIFLEVDTGNLYYSTHEGVWTLIVGGSTGSTVTVSDEAPEDPYIGSLWWKSDDSKLFIYYIVDEEGRWEEVSSLSNGEQGPQGDQGDQGEQGYQGHQGQGYQGDQGDQGDQGEQG